ncbi:MAG: DsbA family protein [Rhodobacteraceae bacterium]|nr:DsbA family protein [Paracoccaceae bacterium]
MIRALLTTLLLLIGTSVAAFDISEMTDAERADFRAEIRAYLLENPEVLMEAIAVLEEREANQQAMDDVALIAANAEDLFTNPTSWTGGNIDGDITIVEFLDYRCGFCKRAHPDVAELIETDGNIKLVVKEFPILGEQSIAASRFALGVKISQGDAAYKAIQDGLMSMRGDVNTRALRRLAASLDLDPDTAFAAADSQEVTDILRANRALGQRLNITGTPTFVLEDRMLRGYLPLDGMRNVVAELRAE